MFGFLKHDDLIIACLTRSEVGLVRAENQDAVFVDEARTVFCVADGMGGGSEGATASRFVCEAIEKALHRRKDGTATLQTRVQSVDQAITEVNARVLDYARERKFRQMGSTIAVLLVDPQHTGQAAIVHVGDSRIYRVRHGSAELLTKDHTIGGQLGDITSGAQSAGFKSRANPLAHVLTRAIGVEEAVKPDWRKIDIRRGDGFLVCSDGVHDVIPDSLIGEIMTVSADLAEASRRLSDEIVRCGAPDNYTYVMIEVKGVVK